MRFRVGELTFTASVADSAQDTLTIEFRAPKSEMHELVLAAARERQWGGVFSLDDAGEPEAEWRVDDSGFTYVGLEPWGMHHHTWRIVQVERVAITSLVVGPLTLEPYDYREELSEGQLRFAARAPLGDAELDQLAQLSHSVLDVVRVGVSPEPRRMLLEGYVWGPGAHGQAVALVCSDVAEPRVTLLGATELFDVLGLLVEKGLLDRAKLHAARRVHDLDAWAL